MRGSRYANRKSKYNAVKTEVDGIVFDSKAEAKRYGELRLLLMADEIRQIELQPKFPCHVNGDLICTYVADFKYRDQRTGERVIEDVKGMKTPVYKLKKKLVEALYALEIVEITK
tara:strand:+ start:992 stop:1336 length:345 start_codon:yes stop_codon:yes gene_type:complete